MAKKKDLVLDKDSYIINVGNGYIQNLLFVIQNLNYTKHKYNIDHSIYSHHNPLQRSGSKIELYYIRVWDFMPLLLIMISHLNGNDTNLKNMY